MSNKVKKKLNKDILKTNKKIVTYRTTVKLIPK